MAAFPSEDATLRQPKQQTLKELVLNASLPIMVITFSTCLIRSNKYLMKADHFPYPFVLVIMHCVCCSLMALVLRYCQPSLFPALTDPDKKVELSISYYINAILPIALCFAISLVLSNMAYKYLSVAFLQMIKEGNIINIYIMAYFAGLETFSYTQVAILVVMLTATMSCVEGELNFSLIGFIVQGSASFCEAAKTIFQALVLNGKGQKLDPLSTVLVIMPMSGLLLGGVLLFNNLVVDVGFAAQPSWEEIYRYRHFLTLNILNAFALNVAIAVFLKYLSPVSYILTGNIKDIVVVCMGAWIIGERISLTQATGFTMQVLCVFAWTTYKQYGSLVPKMVYETQSETQQSAKAS